MIEQIQVFFTQLQSNFNIPTISFTDIIDIMLVAFIIYQILYWIKETRAWSLFKGIIVLATVGIFAFFLNLNTVLWIFKNTFSVGVIALIILFQPELRKALEQIGNNKFLQNIVQSQKNMDTNSIDILVDAIYALANQKVGALIAVKHEVGLMDIIETGVKIDAEISKELLGNIFYNKAPLHDGGVVIENNRIIAASCIFPLTDKGLISSLGTRHRAGVGVSENSDCITIICSEETGIVSVAIQGILSRDVKPDELKNILVQAEPEERKRWRLRKHES